MTFTIQDLEKIRQYLISTGIKDSQFETVALSDLPSDTTRVVTANGKEYNISSSSIPATKAVVDIQMDNSSEDIVVTKADGTTSLLDSGLTNEEVQTILT